MRTVQKEYFRTRNHETLNKAKALEKELDAENDAWLAGHDPRQLTLFDTPE